MLEVINQDYVAGTAKTTDCRNIRLFSSKFWENADTCNHHWTLIQMRNIYAGAVIIENVFNIIPEWTGCLYQASSKGLFYCPGAVPIKYLWLLYSATCLWISGFIDPRVRKVNGVMKMDNDFANCGRDTENRKQAPGHLFRTRYHRETVHGGCVGLVFSLY